MKNILTLAIIILILASCKSENKKEKEIFDFLNHTAQSFNKNKYELFSLNLIDTVFLTGYHTMEMTNNFVNYPEDETATSDTTMLDYSENFYKDINWLFQPFSRKLHNYIREDDANYADFNGDSNKFLNSIVDDNYSDFRKKFLYDNDFQKKLIHELGSYNEFKNLVNRDSIEKYILIEREKDKEVYGYRYKSLYRINGVLFKTDFLFDKDEKLVEYEELNRG